LSLDILEALLHLRIRHLPRGGLGRGRGRLVDLLLLQVVALLLEGCQLGLHSLDIGVIFRERLLQPRQVRPPFLDRLVQPDEPLVLDGGRLAAHSVLQVVGDERRLVLEALQSALLEHLILVVAIEWPHRSG